MPSSLVLTGNGQGYYMPGWYDNANVMMNDFKSFSNKASGMYYADYADQLNTWRAERANYMNEQQWQATNVWNKYMWDLENEYNSPTAQLQRYLDAGINPIWAMSDGTAGAGTASSLQAGLPAPSQQATATLGLQEMMNQRLMNSETNALNSQLGFGNLDLGYKKFYLDKRISKSTIAKTRAETAMLKSQLQSQEFLNRINLATYDTQVSIKQEELNKLRQEIDVLEKQGELSDSQKSLLSAQKEKEEALKQQIDAATKKVESETFDLLDNLKYRWYTAVTARIQANAAQTGAEASVMQAKTADFALNHQIEKDERELEMKSNEQILSVIDMQRGWIDRAVGTISNFLSSSVGQLDFEQANRAFSYIKAAANTLYKRYYSNPTQSNLDAVNEMQRKIKEFQNDKISIPGVIPTFPNGSSTMNPSGASNGWLP